MFYAAALLLRGVFALIDWKGGLRAWLDGPIAALVRFPLASVLIAAPVAIALVFYKPWLMWFGVPTPDTGIVPNTPAPCRLRRCVRLRLAAQPPAGSPDRLAQSLAAQSYSRHWIDRGVPRDHRSAPGGRAGRARRDADPLCGALRVRGLVLGLCNRRVRAALPQRRETAPCAISRTSSYWLYIAHLPLVMALQVVVSRFDWPWYAKFGAILAVAYTVLLLSYQLLVRYTFVGAILNGRRRKGVTRRGIGVRHDHGWKHSRKRSRVLEGGCRGGEPRPHVGGSGLCRRWTSLCAPMLRRLGPMEGLHPFPGRGVALVRDWNHRRLLGRDYGRRLARTQEPPAGGSARVRSTPRSRVPALPMSR